MRDRKSARVLVSRWVAVALIPIIAYVFYQLSQVVYKSFETNQEIAQLKKTVTELEESKVRLESLNSFLSSDFFAEKEARLKLGMQKEGEKVVVISEQKQAVETGATGKNAQRELSENTEAGIARSNPNRWWDYFFDEDR